MHELIVNLHMHTSYSDGNATHAELAQAALRCGLDAIIITDHNIWVNGPEDYYHDGNRHLLLMVGEEIHDQARDPQKNHLLVFGVKRELSTLAYDSQRLLDAVAEAGGVAFLAHPDDPAAPLINETDIAWVDWNVRGYTGIELWNAFSELKPRLKTYLHALFYAYNPHRVARGPFEETLRRWDQLIAEGRKVVAIGGSDAHALKKRLGPLRRTIFPYEFHFRAVNTHLLVSEPLSGDASVDNRVVLDSLRQGHAFIGYDLPASTKGFRFIAQGADKTAWMGDEISSQKGVTFQVKLPQRAECRLLKDGKVIHTWQKRENCTYITSESGVYRVEVYIWYKGRQRGWIFSNPIYVYG
jgi:hypothetical protein